MKGEVELHLSLEVLGICCHLAVGGVKEEDHFWQVEVVYFSNLNLETVCFHH